MRMKFLSTIVLAALSLSAVAQTRVCIGGDLDSMSPAQITACQLKSAGVRAAATRVGVRDDWHIVVVCDDAGWGDYASFAGKSVAAVMESDQQTDAPMRTTFVRGSKIQASHSSDMDHLLASAMEQMPAAARPAVGKPRPQAHGDLLAALSTHSDRPQEP